MTPISSGLSQSLASAWAQSPGLKPRLAGIDELKSGAAAPAASPTSFSNVLGEMVRGVNESQQKAGQVTAAMQAGQNVPIHQAMIASEEAGVSFQLMLEVRNKMLEGYQELMRMQV